MSKNKYGKTGIKDVLKKMLTAYLSLPYIILGKRSKEIIIRSSCEAYEKYNDRYCMFDLRPKYAKDIEKLHIKTDTQDNEYAVVLQGPLCMEDHFTLNTVRFYKKIFPNAIIIISTWDNADKNELLELEKEGCVLVQSKQPKICGLGNVNFQICSSFAGIKKAKELGVKYVMKTRTDQRIYCQGTYEYLKSLLELCPLGKNEKKYVNSRIITVNGFKGEIFSPYCIQDFFYFGHINDIYKLFDSEYDNRNFKNRPRDYFEYIGLQNTHLNRSIERIPEVYITKEYLKNIGAYQNLDNTIKLSWEIISKYFLVINRDDIKLFWNKYDRYNNSALQGYYYNNHFNNFAEQTWGQQHFLNLIQGHYLYEQELEDYREYKI